MRVLSAAIAAAFCIGIAMPLRAQLPVPYDTTAALGTRQHPVFTYGPSGQREYIARMRCPNGSAPKIEGRGSSPAPDGHFIDGYTLRCSESALHMVYMDMYHSGREMRPVPPFTVLAEHPARLAEGCPPRVVPDADSSARYVFIWYEVAKPVRPISRLDTAIVGPRAALLNMSFVVDTAGVPEMPSFQLLAPDTSMTEFARSVASTLRFTPAEHHPGCKVRQFSGANITVKKQN